MNHVVAIRNNACLRHFDLDFTFQIKKLRYIFILSDKMSIHLHRSMTKVNPFLTSLVLNTTFKS